MSVTQHFNYWRVFPGGGCIPSLDHDATTRRIYGLSLEDAMAYIWNTETLRFQISMAVAMHLTSDPMTTIDVDLDLDITFDRFWTSLSASVVREPYQRVCGAGLGTDFISGNSPVAHAGAWTEVNNGGTPVTPDAVAYLYPGSARQHTADDLYWFPHGGEPLINSYLSGSPVGFVITHYPPIGGQITAASHTGVSVGGGLMDFYFPFNSNYTIDSSSMSVVVTPSYYTYP